MPVSVSVGVGQPGMRKSQLHSQLHLAADTPWKAVLMARAGGWEAWTEILAPSLTLAQPQLFVFW